MGTEKDRKKDKRGERDWLGERERENWGDSSSFIPRSWQWQVTVADDVVSVCYVPGRSLVKSPVS